jgi:hypothetical protein
MKLTFMIFIFRLSIALLVISLFESCGSFAAGFGSYERPCKWTNKYYSRHFHSTNSNLVIGKHYLDIANNEKFYFVFYSNGFVLHNDEAPLSANGTKPEKLDYSKIYAQDVGSYKIKGDTAFWATKAGYMKKRSYYSALITDSGLHIISCPEFVKARFLTVLK